jgi:hypothetical protein
MARTKLDHPRPKTSDELLALIGDGIWVSPLPDIFGEALQKEIAAALLWYLAGEGDTGHPPSIYLRKITDADPERDSDGYKNDSETVLVFQPSEPLDDLTTVVPLREVLKEYIEEDCELPSGIGDAKYESEARQKLQDLRYLLVVAIAAIDRMLNRG